MKNWESMQALNYWNMYLLNKMILRYVRILVWTNIFYVDFVINIKLTNCVMLTFVLGRRIMHRIAVYFKQTYLWSGVFESFCKERVLYHTSWFAFFSFYHCGRYFKNDKNEASFNQCFKKCKCTLHVSIVFLFKWKA